MSRRKETQASRIPKFANEQEAAEFWDTHSPLDYPEEFEEVRVRFSKPLIKRGLTIKFSESTIQELKEIAERQGIGPSALARMWILEHLKELVKAAPEAKAS